MASKLRPVWDGSRTLIFRRNPERLRDFEGDRHAASRHSQNDNIIAIDKVSQFFRQQPSRIGSDLKASCHITCLGLFSFSRAALVACSCHSIAGESESNRSRVRTTRWNSQRRANIHHRLIFANRRLSVPLRTWYDARHSPEIILRRKVREP
jgi:hypothetical protein